eukprot:COSAG01_NODE_5991_length_3913_cov_438.897483_9_plen_118_part_00
METVVALGVLSHSWVQIWPDPFNFFNFITRSIVGEQELELDMTPGDCGRATNNAPPRPAWIARCMSWIARCSCSSSCSAGTSPTPIARSASQNTSLTKWLAKPSCQLGVSAVAAASG